MDTTDTVKIDPATVLHVGDIVDAEGGQTLEIVELTACLRPHADPAGEMYGVSVEACEAGILSVADLRSGTGQRLWAYGSQIRRIVHRANDEGRTP